MSAQCDVPVMKRANALGLIFDKMLNACQGSMDPFGITTFVT